MLFSNIVGYILENTFSSYKFVEDWLKIEDKLIKLNISNVRFQSITLYMKSSFGRWKTLKVSVTFSIKSEHKQ